MRSMSLLLIAGFSAACGSKQPGSGNTGPQRVSLQITTTGAGLVRGAGPDCRGSCTVEMDKGSAVHLTAVAGEGATFSGWGGACSGTGACDLRLDGAASVSAGFGTATQPPPGSHLVTVTIEGS